MDSPTAAPDASPTAPPTDGRLLRGLASRVAILDGAATVIRDQGVDGLTHRAVAGATGVPLARVSYHFPTVDDLLVAASGHFLAVFDERLAELAQSSRVGERSIVDACTEFLVELLAEGRDDFVAAVQVRIALHRRGLVTDDGSVSDLPFGSFEDRAVYVVDVAGLEEDAQDLIFARLVSKLREHLERRDLGVKHVVVFVDELNKYAPSEGQDTYVRKMLLDIAERGRYLGLVLFSAQQFRSQVHRRVVGNSGTALYGRMDMDELATPGYAVLSPSTRTKLATLEKGQLMVRHPHFAQPIFVRFPRPAVLRGRDGVERFPQAEEVTLEVAVMRALRVLDPAISLDWVKRTIAGHDEADVLHGGFAS